MWLSAVWISAAGRLSGKSEVDLARGQKELSVEPLPGNPQGTELEEALEEAEESVWIRQSKPERLGAKTGSPIASVC